MQLVYYHAEKGKEGTSNAEDIETDITIIDRHSNVYITNAWLLFHGRKLVWGAMPDKRGACNSVADNDIYDIYSWRMAGGNEIWNNYGNYRNLRHTIQKIQ